MNENTQERTMRNAYHIIKLDKDIWDNITEFVEGYDNLNIMICVANTTENYDTMESAYDAICKYTDDIHIIKISADKLDEQIELKYTNDDLPINYLQEFKYTCSIDREREIRHYFDELREDSRVVKKGTVGLFSVFFGIIAILPNLNRFLGEYAFIIPPLMLFTVVLAGILAFNDKLTRWIIGEKHIQFWTSQEQITEYEYGNIKRRSTANVLVIVSSVVVIMSGVLNILVLIFM